LRKYIVKGIRVIVTIIRIEFVPEIFTLKTWLAKRILRETRAIDKPVDNMPLSRTWSFLKIIRVQANPGKNKTRTIPNTALMKGNRSKKGIAA
jgi:hypothetical protein